MLWQHIMMCENTLLRVQLARVCVVRYVRSAQRTTALLFLRVLYFMVLVLVHCSCIVMVHVLVWCFGPCAVLVVFLVLVFFLYCVCALSLFIVLVLCYPN